MYMYMNPVYVSVIYKKAVMVGPNKPVAHVYVDDVHVNIHVMFIKLL